MKKSLIAATSVFALLALNAYAAADAAKPTDTMTAPSAVGSTATGDAATPSTGGSSMGSADTGGAMTAPATPAAPISDADKK